MINNFEDIQKMSRDNIDLALVSVGAVGKGLQALASEAADYSKHSFEAGTAAFEKLLSAGTLDKAGQPAQALPVTQILPDHPRAPVEAEQLVGHG